MREELQGDERPKRSSRPYRITIIRYANASYVLGALYRPVKLFGPWRHVSTVEHRGGIDPATDVVLGLEEHIPAGIPYEIDDPMNPAPGSWQNWGPEATEIGWSQP